MPIPGFNPDATQQTPPNAAAVLGSAQNAQASPNAPTPQTAPTAPIPIQPVQAAPINPALARNAMTGAGFHALMGTHGVVGDNGTVQQAPNKPGDLFRSILAGAITGMASGAQAKMGGGIGSFAVGAGGAQQQGQQQKDRLQQQSQQQFQNQQEVNKAAAEKSAQDRESQLVNAQIANFQAEQTVRQHTMDLQDKEYMDKHNEANRALYSTLVSAGGTAPPEGEVPATIDAYDLSKLYTDTKGAIRQPANQNMTRHFIDTTSAEEVSWDPVKNIWVGEDGKPADMTAKTEFRVLDVPKNNMTSKISTPNKDIFSALGYTVPGMDPKGSTMMAPVDLINLRTNHMKDERENRGAEIQDRQNKIAEYNAAEGKVLRDNDALKTQVNELKESPVADLDGSKAAALNSRLDSNNSWLDEQYDTIWGTKKAKTTGSPAPSPAPNQKVLSALQNVPGVSSSAAAAVATMKPEDIKAYLPTAKLPDNVKAALYEAIGEKPPVVKSILNPMGQAVAKTAQSVIPAISTATSVLP